MRYWMMSIAVAVACAASSLAAAADFPLRAKYPDAPTISVDELNAQYSDVLIVDVRSKFEFDVIHVANAQLLPMSDRSFLDEAKKLQAASGGKKLVFYCNGHLCAKSYDAASLCQKNGVANVAVFDAGPFEWVASHPEKTKLLGKAPADPSKLISKDKLGAHMISYDEAKTRAATSHAIDVRDPVQREKIPDLPNLRNVPLDRLEPLLKEGRLKDKPIVFIDAVGSQVAWLQYYLEEYGYKDYSFVKGGMQSASVCTKC
jgi:rhodanese-related sulfurtransferase